MWPSMRKWTDETKIEMEAGHDQKRKSGKLEMVIRNFNINNYGVMVITFMSYSPTA